jgi:Protein of unknown function (DUF1569)
MAERRTLTFASLDDVMTDVERLLEGHVTVGRWSLAQICNHLATAIRLTLDVRRRPSEPSPEQDDARRRFFAQGKFPEGMEAPIPILVPEPDLNARTEADSLRGVLARFAAFDGALPAHPRLGAMTRDEWIRFHCIHCAHHLGFVVPQETRTPPVSSA